MADVTLKEVLLLEQLQECEAENERLKAELADLRAKLESALVMATKPKDMPEFLAEYIRSLDDKEAHELREYLEPALTTTRLTAVDEIIDYLIDYHF